jgi:hypothetical protein
VSRPILPDEKFAAYSGLVSCILIIIGAGLYALAKAFL